MFKVPVSRDAPTSDDTFTVGFWQWLTSRKADRTEWTRRRKVAAHQEAWVPEGHRRRFWLRPGE